MKLLWVENHARFARITGREFLSEHSVTIVPSLQAAREALAADAFDAILLDFDLDDGVGSELLDGVQLPSPRPFMVAVSAHEAGNEALLAAGANAACLKAGFASISTVLGELSRAIDAPST